MGASGVMAGLEVSSAGEVLTELLEARGLIRESGRRRNETGRACGEGLGHTETDVEQHWHSKGLRNLGVRAATGSPHPDPKTCVLDEEQVKKGVRCGFWGLCGPSSLLSVLIVPNWLLPSHL